jgi:type VI secretion system secreted protein VgrG
MIESPLALLAHRIASRVFQELSVPDIVQQILEEHAAKNPAIASILNMKLALRKKYMARSYCNQYRESDLAFIERILFEEGIAFRWEHEAGETPKCHFILFDDPTTCRKPRKPRCVSIAQKQPNRKTA